MKLAKQKVELDNMNYNNSDLREENSKLNRENEKLKDKIDRMKEKNKHESAKLSKPNIDSEEEYKVASEELEEVKKYKRNYNNLFNYVQY
jgi:hypothetical protein